MWYGRWRRKGEEGRGENMEAVQNMGQKTSKYMPYQLKTTPNFGRESTTVSMEFFKKPLGDHMGNHMLAQTFRGSAGKRSQSAGAVSGETIYSDSFCPSRSVEERLKAKQASTAPLLFTTNTIGGVGSMMVTRSY